MAPRNSLPVLPAAHLRAISALQEYDVPLDTVAHVINSDPSLLAAVLRAGNSAASSPVHRAGTAERAVARIGLNATRRIVTAAMVGTTLEPLQDAGLDLDGLWQHLVISGVLADRALTTEELRPFAFSAGLLHDLGRIALAHVHGGRYRAVVERVRAGEDARTVERELLGTDHKAFGVEVAEEWRLPEALTESIAHHHEPREPLARAVSQARRAATAAGLSDGVHEPPAVLTDPAQLHPDVALLLSTVGGVQSLQNQVAWYRSIAA